VVTITALSALEETPHASVFDGSDPRVVRLDLAAGDEIPAHRHPETTVVCHVLAGRVELTLGDATHDLSAGDVARFAGDQPIAPAAVTDATALLVLAATP
jgi:quercetin dioxygenase-like cupin family protein